MPSETETAALVVASNPAGWLIQVQRYLRGNNVAYIDYFAKWLLDRDTAAEVQAQSRLALALLTIRDGSLQDVLYQLQMIIAPSHMHAVSWWEQALRVQALCLKAEVALRYHQDNETERYVRLAVAAADNLEVTAGSAAVRDLMIVTAGLTSARNCLAQAVERGSRLFDVRQELETALARIALVPDHNPLLPSVLRQLLAHLIVAQCAVGDAIGANVSLGEYVRLEGAGIVLPAYGQMLLTDLVATSLSHPHVCSTVRTQATSVARHLLSVI